MQVQTVLAENDGSSCAAVDSSLELQAPHVTDKAGQADVAQVAEDPGQAKRSHAIDVEGIVQRGSIVAINHAAALAGPPPVTVFTE